MKVILCLIFLLYSVSAENLDNGWKQHSVSGKRALWVWGPAKTRKWDGKNTNQQFASNYQNSHDLLIEFCRSKSIRVLYLYIGSCQWSKEEFASGNFKHETHYAKLIKKARSYGMQVWGMYYINDNMNVLKGGVEGVKNIINTVSAFNRKYPDAAFAGIQSDQEPSKMEVYPEFLKQLSICQKYCNEKAPGLIFSQTMKPKYLRDKIEFNGKIKPVSEHVIDLTDHTALMAYSQYYKTVMRWSVPVCEYATSVNKKVAVGLELNYLKGWKGCEQETFWEEIINRPLNKRFSVAPKSVEESLQNIDKELSKYKGFDRMVIHSYKNYFAQWFSEKADYEPIKHPSDISTWKFQPVDLTKDSRPLYSK